jgi:immunity protein Imm1 of predicted polymorphic toxin system
MFVEIQWRSIIQAESIGELDDALDAIAREVSPEFPQAVNVTRANGDCLTIVLGAKEGSILSFISGSGDPPYFVSVGDQTANGIFTFFVEQDHHSEALTAHVIPEAQAREAVREFASQSAGLPRNVTWTEV